jgi:hypothetical protein
MAIKKHENLQQRTMRPSECEAFEAGWDARDAESCAAEVTGKSSTPFLYAIETPEGDWYDGSGGEACVFGDVQSACDAILGLNEEAPDDQQFKVVPLYRDAEMLTESRSKVTSTASTPGESHRCIKWITGTIFCSRPDGHDGSCVFYPDKFTRQRLGDEPCFTSQARDAQLAPVTGKTFEAVWNVFLKEVSALLTKDIAEYFWNAALASKEAEIATKNAELQSVREAYMEIERKLQIKLASAEARIEAAMKLADELRKKSVSAREDRIAYELIRALGRKVEP